MLRHTPGSEKTDLSQSKSGQAKAQECQHRIALVEQLPGGHAHHQREFCGECGAFLKWGAKFENLQRQAGNSFAIARLSMCSLLSSWESEFLASIAQQRRLSPKQQQILERLVEKYLEAKAP